MAGFNGPIPIEVTIDPGTPTPDQKITVTVVLSGAPTSDLAVAIGATVPSAFSGLPYQVTVPAGQLSVTFNCATSSTYVSSAQISATCNGGTALSGDPSPGPGRVQG